MRPILPSLAAAVALAAVGASSASAATYCVGNPSCAAGSQQKPTIDAALASARANPGLDTIVLANKEFTGNWTIKADNPVNLTGPVFSQTKLRSNATRGLVVENGQSTIQNLAVIPKAESGAIGIDLWADGAKLNSVGVYGDGTAKQRAGIKVRKGATLQNVQVKMSTAEQASWGISAVPAGSAAALKLDSVDVTADRGILLEEWPSPVTARQVKVLAGFTGVRARAVGPIRFDGLSAWISQSPDDALGGVALEAMQHPSAKTPMTLDVRHATLTARHPGATALRLAGSPAPAPVLTTSVRDSALLGPAAAKGDDLTVDGRSAVALRRSAWRPGRAQGVFTQPDGDNVDLSASYLGLPGLEGGGFLPQSGSALIDAGTPGPLAKDEPPSDVEFRTRILDGDSDGVARRDIGAYEAWANTSPAPAKVVRIATGAAPVATPTPTPTPVPPVVTPPVVTPPPTTAGVAPRVTIRGLAGRRVAGRATGGVARVQVAIMSRKGKRCRSATAAGRLKAAGRAKGRTCAPKRWLTAKGTGAWALTLRRPLPNGAYVVTARARDAQGRVVAIASRKAAR